MKNFSDIQALLDRYWEGETTLEEERTLKAYFTSGQVDERLRAVAPFFQALREEQTIQYTKTQKVALKPVFYNWQKMAAAASVALLLTAGGWWWTSRQKPVQQQIAQQPPAEEQLQSLPEKTAALPTTAPENSVQTLTSIPPAPARKTPVGHKKAVQPAENIDPETEQAMEEIKAALALLSSKLKKGKEEAVKGASHLESVDKILKKKSEG